MMNLRVVSSASRASDAVNAPLLRGDGREPRFASATHAAVEPVGRRAEDLLARLEQQEQALQLRACPA